MLNCACAANVGHNYVHMNAPFSPPQPPPPPHPPLPSFRPVCAAERQQHTAEMGLAVLSRIHNVIQHAQASGKGTLISKLADSVIPFFA